ncbi:MAG: hypothetical protein IKA72_00695 [Clostridia bacterium]|nr:hypothetical protein [Clostridia bacterium]
MKKAIYSILSLGFAFTLVGCDKSHLCSLDVQCLNENVSIVVDGEKLNSFNFSSEGLNHQPSERYSNIDFANPENNPSNANVNKFEIESLTSDTYNLSLELVKANKYVVDFLRVGIIVDNELRVYKYYDKRENIYHKENDPESMLHFNSKSEIFSEWTIDFSAGESKEIFTFIWIEEAELYNKNGERYTGWADKSYAASPIILSMQLE